MYECETCTRTFYSWSTCRQHMKDKGHWPVFECETCNADFNSEEEADWHMSRYGHYAPKIPCETCGQRFHTQDSADQHMGQLRHYRNYCRACDQRFQTENGLKMHLNSKIHRGQNILCPFCKAGGSCPRAPSLNRETIYKFVRSRDTQGVLTKKMLEWHDDDNAKYSATDHAFNGYYWECYICHRGFNTMTALNQHLNSTVHKQKLYHCPNVKGRCRKEFVTLAALFNHLESESCGFMRFEKVQLQAQNVFAGNRLIGF
ncbi:hypothetical protein BO94DRAFT_585793 [Aspergillus sclerotioniger CBS 115572]|uniref:C2H2-type domain-containing protein n=1 Tax=Aspergillus sclerotioniger CBS 115572 TaxID=1450535 RepID=A0A317WLN0_9EURO|nr:hypothetical protein BO94DRAFT_585793 [Aspergillus sclerotioniger CBS 115572]PWY87239.1 hypothetical protein BO94DRAFT_585793 [Aspergillus sclerotioniger CBS 115572]